MGLQVEVLHRKGIPGVLFIEGADSLFLCRHVSQIRYRIVSACFWRQLLSPSPTKWIDIEYEAILKEALQTQTIEIYWILSSYVSPKYCILPFFFSLEVSALKVF